MLGMFGAVRFMIGMGDCGMGDFISIVFSRELVVEVAEDDVMSKGVCRGVLAVIIDVFDWGPWLDQHHS